MNLNNVQLIGRVTRDPELKTTASGVAIVSFGIATNHTFKTKEGEKKETVQFHNCTTFGKGAETLKQWVTKGQELYVQGRIEYQEWEKKDGSKGYRTEIMVEQFQFGQKSKGTQSDSSQPEPEREELTPAAEAGVDIDKIEF